MAGLNATKIQLPIRIALIVRNDIDFKEATMDA